MTAYETLSCLAVSAWSTTVLIWCGLKAYNHESSARGDEDD